jgi:hypothetical protein
MPETFQVVSLLTTRVVVAIDSAQEIPFQLPARFDSVQHADFVRSHHITHKSAVSIAAPRKSIRLPLRSSCHKLLLAASSVPCAAEYRTQSVALSENVTLVVSALAKIDSRLFVALPLPRISKARTVLTVTILPRQTCWKFHAFQYCCRHYPALLAVTSGRRPGQLDTILVVSITFTIDMTFVMQGQIRRLVWVPLRL